MTRTDSLKGKCALMAAHCGGMVDIVALPIWVGTLIADYKFDPQQAGALATLFLAGGLVSSLFFAPRFNKIGGRIAATVGFGLAALAYFCISLTRDFAIMAVLHGLAGITSGCALSFTHGTIGRSANPHRLFAIVGTALGFFAIAFLGTMPQLVARTGGATLFITLAAVVGVVAIVAAICFPQADQQEDALANSRNKLTPAVWFLIFGIIGMALLQAMMFSFLERIGMDRGYGLATVTTILVTLGFVNLFPAPLAAFLQKHLSANKVILTGPFAQAILTTMMAQAFGFSFYAIGACLFAAVMIFTHTFAFGLLAKLDKTGRSLAATPAMLGVGATIGPILGGTMVKFYGYPSLSYVAIVVAALSVICFSRAKA
jgi:predicted MFS family arabinose efflux permease